MFTNYHHSFLTGTNLKTSKNCFPEFIAKLERFYGKKEKSFFVQLCRSKNAGMIYY
jgi:hypothetical protein